MHFRRMHELVGSFGAAAVVINLVFRSFEVVMLNKPTAKNEYVVGFHFWLNSKHNC